MSEGNPANLCSPPRLARSLFSFLSFVEVAPSPLQPLRTFWVKAAAMLKLGADNFLEWDPEEREIGSMFMCVGHWVSVALITTNSALETINISRSS